MRVNDEIWKIYEFIIRPHFRDRRSYKARLRWLGIKHRPDQTTTGIKHRPTQRCIKAIITQSTEAK